MTVREHIRYHLRLPGVLLCALLITVVTISGLTFTAIKGQRGELREAQILSQEQSLKLLSNRIEQNLLETVQKPFRLLHNIQTNEVEDETFHKFFATLTNVSQILILDANMQLAYSYPPPENEHDVNLNNWISERSQEKNMFTKTLPNYPQTFLEHIRGHNFLYAIEPIIHVRNIESMTFNMPVDPESWMMVRFDLSDLLTQIITPLINDFKTIHGGTVRLASADAAVDDNSITEPLTKILPGWKLIYSPAFNASKYQILKQNLLLISLAAGAVLAIILAGFAIWWELRREYADVELRNRFIANVSHELKTPLSLIRMYTETLLLRRVNELDKQQEYHRVILREAERLSKLIENVLDFSHLRSGRDIYHLTEMNLRKTVAMVLEQYKLQFEKLGLIIEIFLQEHLPPVAHDPNGITQIILNLLDNAAKYASVNKTVQVRLTGDDNWVDLEIIDFGPGLSEKQHTQLLRSLHNGRLTDVIKGSGIGLSMVDLIAKAHHAHFVLDTPEDHSGLKAIFSFPSYKQSV